MSTQIKLGFAILSVLTIAGCGGQTSTNDLTADQDVESGKEDSARRRAHPELYACATDDDCVAVEKAGCCPNGFLVAVNQGEVKAYDTTYACQTPPAACPLLVVHDTRVAQCNFGTHQCEMIDPSLIRCGGFIDPSMQHHCPSGWQCDFSGHVPDLPGTCVQSN